MDRLCLQQVEFPLPEPPAGVCGLPSHSADDETGAKLACVEPMVQRERCGAGSENGDIERYPWGALRID